jgi:uncharacterized membrane protein
MTADGVMPPRAERARFTDVGSVESLGGLPLHVRVSGDAVIVAGHYLNAAQRETFAALFVRACWLAGNGEP